MKLGKMRLEKDLPFLSCGSDLEPDFLNKTKECREFSRVIKEPWRSKAASSRRTPKLTTTTENIRVN